MNYTEKLTRYVANFVDELAHSGVKHVVISPGSRSTPLAMLFREHEQITDWVIIDERSAAFFALGMAKYTNSPVALVCTSGTAAANYFPAIAEAKYGRVPLLVLTADRPHDLRGVGAPQTMDQLAMYGSYVKEFIEMALPEATAAQLRYVRSRAARIVRIASMGERGPVHVNFPFAEPLLPDVSLPNVWGDRQVEYNPSYDGIKTLNEEQLTALARNIEGNRRGLLVCGPQVDGGLASAVVSLAKTLNIPILADPLSQVRGVGGAEECVISSYDTILRSKKMRKRLKPDYIIRFGAMPVSKNYMFYVQDHEAAYQVVVEEHEHVREPTNHASEYVFANGVQFCHTLAEKLKSSSTVSDWLDYWQTLHEAVVASFQFNEEDSLTEGIAVQTALTEAPENSIIFAGNSMPIRDIDTFYIARNKHLEIHGNRGVSGIDGVVSSALGMAATANERVTLIIGDLSFYHDLNGLLVALHYRLDMTVLLINNDGGGIFSFLPQATEKRHFEPLFGTPIGIDFRHAATLYQAHYEVASTQKSLREALKSSYKRQGLSIVEVQTDREENVRWHRSILDSVAKKVETSDA